MRSAAAELVYGFMGYAAQTVDCLMGWLGHLVHTTVQGSTG
jgi:hypothetical protein